MVKPAYLFGIEIPVQNTVGNEAYGLYFAFLNFTYLFQIIHDPGLQNFNSREISSNPSLINRVFPSIVLLKGLLACVFIALAGLLAIGLGYWKADPLLLCIVMFNQIAASYLLFLRTNVSGLGKYTTDSLLSIADKGFMLLVLGILLWFIKPVWFNIHTFALLQACSFLLAISMTMFVLRASINWQVPKQLFHEFSALLKRSLPYATTVFLMFLYTRTDAVMLEALLIDGAYQAGIYAAAYRIMDAFTMFSFLFAGLLLPMFSSMIAAGKPTNQLFIKSLDWIFAIEVIAVVPIWMFRNEIMGLLYEDTHISSGMILGILMVAFAFKATNFVSGSLLVAQEKLRNLTILLAATVLLNVSLNFILIPQQGAYGASLATLISQVIVGVGMFILCLRTIQFKNTIPSLLKWVTIGCAIFPMEYISTNYLDSVHWTIQFGCFLSVCIIASLLFGLVRPRDFTYFAEGLSRRRGIDQNS